MEDSINQQEKAEIIKIILDKIQNNYIFPEIAKKVHDTIGNYLNNGKYNDYSDFKSFCFQLTQDIQKISDDKHFYVEYNPEKAKNQTKIEQGNFQEDVENELEKKKILKIEKYHNFHIPKIERLPGNVGYFRIDEFSKAEDAGDVIFGAMQYLSNTYALIFDVRYNGGGESSTVQLIISYLLSGEPQLLVSFYDPIKKKEEQSWTLPYVPGKKYIKKPVYVLISGRSASAAEEFAYDLKHLKRAVLVGEKTRGAANAIEYFPVKDKIILDIPIFQPVNPITKSNWEGIGVVPDVEVSQEKALKTAHLMALKKIKEKQINANVKENFEFECDYIRSKYQSEVIQADEFSKCLGTYGPYKVEMKEEIATIEIKTIKYELITGDNRIFFLDEKSSIMFGIEENKRYLEFRSRYFLKPLKIFKNS